MFWYKQNTEVKAFLLICLAEGEVESLCNDLTTILFIEKAFCFVISTLQMSVSCTGFAGIFLQDQM